MPAELVAEVQKPLQVTASSVDEPRDFWNPDLKSAC